MIADAFIIHQKIRDKEQAEQVVFEFEIIYEKQIHHLSNITSIDAMEYFEQKISPTKQ